MSVNTSHPTTSNQPPLVVNGELHCALSGKAINPDEAYWAPPLVTAGELVSTVAQTAVRSPSNLGHILFGEQQNVPYAPDMREELGNRRTVEQLKLLGLLLLVAALIVVPVYLLVIG